MKHSPPTGDIRRLCDLFGLSVTAAERYTRILDNIGLARTVRT